MLHNKHDDVDVSCFCVNQTFDAKKKKQPKVAFFFFLLVFRIILIQAGKDFIFLSELLFKERL